MAKFPASLRLTLAVLVALAMGAAILPQGYTAAAVLAGDGAAGLSASPRSSLAGALLAERLFADGQPGQALTVAQAALASSPMNARALRTYGLALEKEGNAARADRALRLAGLLGWRDNGTMIWLLEDALRRGDVVAGAQFADAMLRRRQDEPQMHGVMRALAAAPSGADAVSARLASAPAWRRGFLQDVAPLTPPDYPAMEALFARLSASRLPPMPDEVAPYADLLIQRGAFARARHAWLSWGAPGSAPGAMLQDGEFERLADDGAASFGWTMPAGTGGGISHDDMFLAGEHVVRADADGLVSRPLLTQLVVLPAGRHALAMDAADSQRDAADAIDWSLRCVGQESTIPTTLRMIRTGGRWTRLMLTFDVPDGCPAQSLTLAARSIDRHGSYSRWFSHASLN